MKGNAKKRKHSLQAVHCRSRAHGHFDLLILSKKGDKQVTLVGYHFFLRFT